MSEIKKQLAKTTIYLVVDGKNILETLMSEDNKSLLNFFKINGYFEKTKNAENFYFALDNFFNISISEENATIENLAYIFSLVKSHENIAIALLKSIDFNACYNLEVISPMCNNEFLGIFESKGNFFNSFSNDYFSNERKFLFCGLNKNVYVFNSDYEKYLSDYDEIKRERDYDMMQFGMVWCHESKEYL